MNTDGIFITTTTIKSLPKPEQDFLFGIISGRGMITPEPQSVDDEGYVEDDHFAELSPGQARDFYSGCGVKTRKAIDVIADSASHRFQLADIAKALSEKPGDLRGVWSGLTRRLKTITGDSSAYLIDWEKHKGVFDDDGNYIDHTCEVTEMTYRSFRKALGRS